jgi:hypothetical protein
MPVDAPAPDLFILGAGFSRAIDQRMPVMAELTWALAEELPKSLLTEVPFLAEDFELGLTYLAEGHPGLSEPVRLRNRALFLEITQRLAKLLVERTNQVNTALSCSWLAPFAHYLHDRKATIATLNYDTLLETAFGNISVRDTKRGTGLLDTRCVVGLEVDYGNVFATDVKPSARMLKLHGSTSWFYSGSDSYYGEAIYGRQLPGKVPLILPPVAQKNTYFKNELVQGQWALAAEAIATADRIFCIGYSLPLTDLTFRFLLQTPRETRAHFYVVNRDEERLGHFKKNIASAFDVVGDFCGGEDCISRLVEYFERELLRPSGDAHTSGLTFCSDISAAGIVAGSQLNLVGTDRIVTSVTCDEQAFVIRENGIICRVPWGCFEATLNKMAEETRNGAPCPCLLNSIDDTLSQLVPRDVSRTVVTLLERLGRVRYFEQYNSEYVEAVHPSAAVNSTA